ncbi:MAG: hypothetical protein COA43_16510 [Robiginitomaculum sp.]|nr:MAG: hypothetical protein COA43_16510 [Robiginitomaculum sp.]
MEQFLPLIIGLGSGALGGNVAGKLLGSKMGVIGRSLTGIIGGGGLAALLPMLTGGSVDAGAAAGAMTSGLDVTSILKSVAGGGVGGGVLTAILGKVMGGKA